MASELFYYCDPDKNTKCRKRNCFKGDNPWRNCKFTRHIECAQTDRDGIPLIYGLKFEGGAGKKLEDMEREGRERKET